MIILKFIVQYNSGLDEEFYLKADVAQEMLNAMKDKIPFFQIPALSGLEIEEGFIIYDEIFHIVLNLNLIERIQMVVVKATKYDAHAREVK
jgi:hypothetical protein